MPDLDARAEPRRISFQPGYERWDGNGAVGYLTLARIVEAQLAEPPERARLVVAAHCFPTGFLGYWVRRLAENGLVAALTATSPPRLASPDGGPVLAGTNPLAIAVPSSDGKPLVADVSMGKVTYGDVLRGAAAEDDLVPFGEEQAHKAFALAEEVEAPLLGRIPFDPKLAAYADEGEPIVLAEPDAEVSQAIVALAEAIAATKREQGVGIVKPLPLLSA